MNCILKMWLVAILCLVIQEQVHAQSDSLTYLMRQVTNPINDSARFQALHTLAKLREPITFPFLKAIQDKNLYLYKNQPVSTGQPKKKTSGQDVYPVVKLSIDEIPELDSSSLEYVALASLTPVTISRGDRLALLPVQPFLNLTHSDPVLRIMAYSQLADKKNNTLIQIIDKALRTEKNEEVRRAGKEARFTMQLRMVKSDAEAKSLIDSLDQNWGDNVTMTLKKYAEKTPLADAKAYALQKVSDLEQLQRNIQKAQNLFSGLSLGSILILIALGLAIVYGLAGIINMAHGEFLMIGAYTTFCVQSMFSSMGIQSDLFFILSLPISFLVAGIFGLALERLVIRHLYSRPLESLLATWGVSLILVQLARSLFGDLTAIKAPTFLAGGWQVIPHLILPFNRLFIIGLTIVVVSLTYLMLYRSRLGRQIRAVTQNRNMSACLGVETRKVDAITFFLGSGLAGLAGCAMTLIGNVVPDMGQTYIVDSFLVVVTGGVGKIAGAIVSGLGIGFLTKILESFYEAVYGKVLILGLIMLFLQFKPKGLLPDKGRIAED